MDSTASLLFTAFKKGVFTALLAVFKAKSGAQYLNELPNKQQTVFGTF